MPIGLILLGVFIGVPVLEIGVFIALGGQIGLWPTLALIVVTALAGSALLRHQGLSLITRIRGEMDAGRVPGQDLGHGAMILAAGILLLTPGFVTDAVGFTLFIPAVRRMIWRALAARIAVTVTTSGGPGPKAEPEHPDVVDLDDSEWSQDPNPSTPWRKPPDGRSIEDS